MCGVNDVTMSQQGCVKCMYYQRMISLDKALCYVISSPGDYWGKSEAVSYFKLLQRLCLFLIYFTQRGKIFTHGVTVILVRRKSSNMTNKKYMRVNMRRFSLFWICYTLKTVGYTWYLTSIPNYIFIVIIKSPLMPTAWRRASLSRSYLFATRKT